MRAPDAGGGAIATETLQKMLAAPLTVHTELFLRLLRNLSHLVMRISRHCKNCESPVRNMYAHLEI